VAWAAGFVITQASTALLVALGVFLLWVRPRTRGTVAFGVYNIALAAAVFLQNLFLTGSFEDAPLHRMPSAQLALVVLYFLFGRGGGSLSGVEARKLVAEGAALVDVRTPEEFAAGHLQGAVNIPLSQVEKRLKEFGPKDRPIVVYCRSGSRSASAARTLKSNGYLQVQDLGSMGRW
jgi:rhodanese-related sulfurtransferase